MAGARSQADRTRQAQKNPAFAPGVSSRQYDGIFFC